MRVLWLLVLLASQAFAQRVLLVESGRVGVPEKKSAEVLERLRDTFTRAGLEVTPLKVSCAGERACLVAAVRAEHRDAIVSVALAMGARALIVDLEGISAASGTVLGQTNFKLKPNEAVLPAAVNEFTRAVQAQLEAETKAATPPVSDAPLKAPALEPVPPPAVVVLPPMPVRSNTPVVLTAVGAGVALVVGAVLVGVGASTQAKLPARDSSAPPIDAATAQRLVAESNTAYSGAVVAGGAALGLGVTALILGVAR